jgi:hypothetical protein
VTVRIARAIGVGLAILLVAGPLYAANQPHNAECKRLTRQIARYERDAKWADERNNALWQQASEERVARLSARRVDLCPQYRKPDLWAKAADFIAMAAKAAAPYFLPGLF